MKLLPRPIFLSVNAARIARLRSRLRWDDRLAAIGHDRARKAYRIERHPLGAQLDRAMSGRWTDAGEALAWLHENRIDPVPLWLASPDHRKLLLDRAWTHGGVGVYRRSGDLTVALIVADRRP